MSSENDSKKKDEIDADERTLTLAMQRHADSAKLLKTKEELLTPKGRAEAVVVDSIESATKCIQWLLRPEPPQGTDAFEMRATAAHGKTQAQLAMWILETAMGMTPATQGNAARNVAARVQAQSLGATLAARLAAQQQQAQRRPRIVDAAIPAQSTDPAAGEPTEP